MATRYFGFAEETTFGTKAAIASYLDPIDVKIVSDTGKIFVETVQNRAAVKQVDGPFKCAGPISFYVEPENIAWFLKWALGSVSSLQGDTSGVYKHTFKPADTVKSWTGEEGAELFARVYTSCLIDKLTIDAVKKEALKGSIDIYAQKEEKEATLDTPSFSTLAPFVFHQGTITLNGVDESSEVEAVSIALANNIPYDDLYTLGSRYIRRNVVEALEVTADLDLHFADADQYDLFLAGTEFSLKAEFVGPSTGSAISGFENYKLTINIPKCIYLSDTAPHIARRERLTLSAPIKAIYDTTTAKIIDIELVNKVASY